VTVTLGLDGSGKVDVVAGGYEDWVRMRYEARLPSSRRREGAGGGSSSPATSQGDKPSPQPSPANGRGGKKLSYKDQRDYDRLPGEIERLEAVVVADETALSDPDLFARDPDRFAELTERIARNRAEIEAAELRWLEVAEMAEALAR
jgi:ATP-binding cassette subfamily F protein uup